jgi:hypothetical protein
MSTNPKPRRRFLRFRLRTLLLLPLVFAAAWWWVTWPERTARRFVELLATGDIDSAKAMTDFSEEELWVLAEIDGIEFKPPVLNSDGWRNYIAARRTFQVPIHADTGGGKLDGFSAVRNRVSQDLTAAKNTFAVYRLKHADAMSIAAALSSVFQGTAGLRINTLVGQNSLLVHAGLNEHLAVRSLIAQLDSLQRPDERSTIFRQPVYRPSEQPAKIIHPTP